MRTEGSESQKKKVGRAVSVPQGLCEAAGSSRQARRLALPSAKGHPDTVNSLPHGCHRAYCPNLHTSAEMRSLGQSAPLPHNAMHMLSTTQYGGHRESQASKWDWDGHERSRVTQRVCSTLMWGRVGRDTQEWNWAGQQGQTAIPSKVSLGRVNTQVTKDWCSSKLATPG